VPIADVGGISPAAKSAYFRENSLVAIFECTDIMLAQFGDSVRFPFLVIQAKPIAAKFVS
jgi:hypothetical protein